MLETATQLACSGVHVQEIIAGSRVIAAVGLSVCTVCFIGSAFSCFRRRRLTWSCFACACCLAANPFWFDDGYRGDCGSTIASLSPLLAILSVAAFSWKGILNWFRPRPE